MGQCCVESILAAARGGAPSAALLLNPDADHRGSLAAPRAAS